jgi:Alpha-glutamyl/putrescinyl thymine pyrophosphorylase clade 3
VPRFCRHNRFIERCPICRESVPGLAPPEGSGRRSRSDRRPVGAEGSGRSTRGGAGRGGSPRIRRSTGLHVSRERRAEDDGYSSPLVRGLRASGDASRLAEEIAFAQGRLLTLTTAPPGLYGEMRELEDAEQAIWMCFLSAYLCPLEGADPFAGIRRALEADWRAGELPNLDSIPLGPRSSHDPARGDATLRAYLQWVARGERSPIDRPELDRSEIGQQALAFEGDPTWSATRRFERLFERLTLPGLARMGRYELLLTLGRTGLCELRAEALYFTSAPGAAQGDLATLAAKRVFGIGEPLHLEHRARELAEAVSVPVEALDLALANWGAGERATLGVPPEALDPDALERARRALDL